MRKSPHLAGIPDSHGDIVIRREGAIDALRKHLTFANGEPRYPDPADNRVCYASPLVDVAGNIILRDETIEACKVILELTRWHIRLLSKSNLLPPAITSPSLRVAAFAAELRDASKTTAT